MPKIRFVNGDGESGEMSVDVEPGTSILEAAEDIHAHVGSACGGNLACSTCHVWVTGGFDSLDEMEEAEDDILDKAFDVRDVSRLGCQAKCKGEDLVVEITPEGLQAWLDEHPAERSKAS